MPLPPLRARPADPAAPPQRRQPLKPLLRRRGLPETPRPLLRSGGLPETPGRYGAAAAMALCCIRGTQHGAVPASCLCSRDSVSKGGEGDCVDMWRSMHGVTYKETRCQLRYRESALPQQLTLFCADTAYEGWSSLPPL